MSRSRESKTATLWAHHDAQWRHPAQIASQWEEAVGTDPRLLRHSVRGAFWDLLEASESTLLVTREYEHLLLALTVVGGERHSTFMRLPHPSGLAFDAGRRRVYVASTRNPNQLYTLEPVVAALPRRDAPSPETQDAPLVPVQSRFLPGCLYLHDLAHVGGVLHGNAVGQNAVVRLDGEEGYERVWWPAAIEAKGSPDFTQNYLQLNSIAAGKDLESSYFSASADRISARRPGHRNFPVDGRGVVFSGRTREPVATGLTRPHSARFHDGAVWVDNSGYGEFGVVNDGSFEPIARLPGWTRGLAFQGDVAFVGVSRVIPRFRHYAPGLDVDRSKCGVFAVDTRSGEILGSLTWPTGNQIFAVEVAPQSFTTGFPFTVGRRPADATRLLFYSFVTDGRNGE